MKSQLTLDLEETIGKLTSRIRALRDTITDIKCQKCSNAERFQMVKRKRKGTSATTTTTKLSDPVASKTNTEIIDLDSSIHLLDKQSS